MTFDSCMTMLSCDCHDLTLTSTCPQTDPLDIYLKKYGLPSKRTIPSGDVVRYGRQILEVSRTVTASLFLVNTPTCCLLRQALQFLNEKGFVLGEFVVLSMLATVCACVVCVCMSVCVTIRQGGHVGRSLLPHS